MRKAYLVVALAVLVGAVFATPGVNRNQSVLAAAAITTAADPLVVSGGTDALLLTCMDYRLTDDVADYMQHERHMDKKYDHVILAGASLGANTAKYPAWGTTFWEHLATAIKLHSIHKVMIMDHRNCGAYKLLLDKDFPEDASPAQLKEETRVHKEQLDLLAKAVHAKYPDLEVETLLMGLDGHVEEIGSIPNAEDKPGVKH